MIYRISYIEWVRYTEFVRLTRAGSLTQRCDNNLIDNEVYYSHNFKQNSKMPFLIYFTHISHCSYAYYSLNYNLLSTAHLLVQPLNNLTVRIARSIDNSLFPIFYRQTDLFLTDLTPCRIRAHKL